MTHRIALVTGGSRGIGAAICRRCSRIAAPSWPVPPRARRIPLGRIGRVEEAASVVAFLGSESASYIHGALIDINGGLFMD
jgi:NAD(P)-dependent dehydrogenase (short-subunit alcohol dehydrogenase family)